MLNHDIVKNNTINLEHNVIYNPVLPNHDYGPKMSHKLSFQSACAKWDKR